MSLPENDGRIEFVGDGTAGPFTVDFKIDDKTEATVQVDNSVKVVDVDYEVSGVGGNSFDVTFLEPFPIVNATIVVIRNQPAKQTSVYAPNENVATIAVRIEKDLDKLARFNQMVLEILGRGLRFATKSLLRNIDVDDPIDQKFLYYDNASGKFKWGTVISAGSLIDPVPIANGGTGVAAASLLALRNGIGLTKDSTGRATLDAAPNSPSYVVIGDHAELPNNRRLTAGAGITLVDGGADQAATISTTGGNRGYRWGGTVSNNGTDPTNDVDIAAGEFMSDDALSANRVLLNPGAMTKQIDAVWAAGTNAGGRISTEALVDGVWHLLAFRRSGGADDYCWSQSLTPTLPDGGTKKRRIYSTRREGGVLIAVVQHGTFFQRAPVLSYNQSPGVDTAFTITLHVPTGFPVLALVNLINVTGGGTGLTRLSDLAMPDLPPSITAAPLSQIQGSPSAGALAELGVGSQLVRTNASGEIRGRVATASAVLRVCVVAWWDDLGMTF